MKRVGLTGTLGAGKSTVGRLFERWGARKIDADELAREAVRPGGPASARIRELWGERVFGEGGELDRAALRRAVTEDPVGRERLEAIVHPVVIRLLEERMAAAGADGARIVVAEIPLLLESGLADRFDSIVVVDAPRGARRERVAAARGLPADEFDALDAAQWPANRKRAAADWVIDNDGGRDELEARAREVWERLAPSGAGVEAAAGTAPQAPDGAAATSDPRPWTMDLHMHTRHSHDCLSDPADVVRTARARGLDRIAITDHDRIGGAFEARELDPELVIVGEEVRTAEGLDLIGLFLERHIPGGGSFREVADEVHAQGGVVYLPHPFCPHRGADEDFLASVADCVDAVEALNARVHDPARNRRAAEWARERDLPAGAGSDAHLLHEIGRARVRVAAFDGRAGFLDALARGAVEGRPSGRWVHLGSTWAKVRKSLSPA